MKQFNSEATETPFDMPETPDGWEIVLFGRIAQIIGGGTPKTSDNGNFSERGYPWITPADLSGFNEMYISWGRRSLSEQGLKTSSAVLLPEGTVLMSSRAPIGYLAIAANELCTNQGFKSFICPPGVLPEYVFFWLKFITPFLEDMGSGSTFLEISGSRARKIPILLAPTSEQKRIAAKVEELLARVNATKDRLAKVSMILKRFRQAVLTAACSGRLTEGWRNQNPSRESGKYLLQAILDERKFSAKKDRTEFNKFAGFDVEESPDLPDSWVWTNVGQITKNFDGQRIPVKADDRANRRGPYHYYGASGIIDTIDDYLFNGKFLLIAEDGANLLSRSTPIAFRASGKFWVNNHAHVVQMHGEIPLQYLEVYLNGIDLQHYVTGSAQPKLTQVAMNRIPVPLPPLTEQKEIVRLVEAMFKLADTVEKRVAAAIARAEKLTQAILAKAFSGELVPTEAELARLEGRPYETASELLARIKSERDAKQTSQKVRRNRN
jgi:type I restriction enzyme S subunit